MFICKANVKHVYQLKGDNMSGLVFLDFKKAFNLVNHKVLLEKIQDYSRLPITRTFKGSRKTDNSNELSGAQRKWPGVRKQKTDFTAQ